MNLSRLAWWVHWFFDIFAWMIIWLISAILILKIFKGNKHINGFNKKAIYFLKKIKF